MMIPALRSLLFYPPYLVFITLFSLLSCTLGLLLPPKPRQTLATTGNWLILHWFRICCGVKVTIVGQDNLPPGPFVALSNHQSAWETYFLQRALKPVSTILKRELLKIPVFGWGLATVHPIAIDRDNPRQALKDVLTQGKERLTMGNNVIVYPEGTRTPFGQYGNYGRSGAALAIAAGVPIVPVAHNAGRCWPAHRFIKFPGTITLVFGAAIDTTDGDSKRLTQQVEHWITSTQKQMG